MLRMASFVLTSFVLTSVVWGVWATMPAVAETSVNYSSEGNMFDLDANWWEHEDSQGSPRGGSQGRAGEKGRGAAEKPWWTFFESQADYDASMAAFPECSGDFGPAPDFCSWRMPDPTDPVGAAQAGPPPEDAVRALARRVALSMTLPSPEVSVGPDPNVNEWDMAVVGYPLWLWTETPGAMESSVTEFGVTISLSAVRERVVFAMGDGGSVSCRVMSPLRAGTKPGTPSPDCGYVYESASLPKGNYTVTATAQWAVSWSALGYSGTVPVEVSAARDLPVGELQAVVVG